MDWIQELAIRHTLEVSPQLYERAIKAFDTENGYTYASAFDAINIAHSNGVNVGAGLEDGTMRLITANERYALINLKEDDKKMSNLNVYLTEEQVMELMQNVDISDYVELLSMDDWNDFMSDTPATEIIDSVDSSHFDTSDEYAVVDGLGRWVSADSLIEILSPYLDDMLQEYLDNTLS